MSSLKKFSATASSTFKQSAAKTARQTSETPVQSATTANTTKSRLRANVSPSSASSQSTKDLTASPAQTRIPRQNLKTNTYAKGKTAKKAAGAAPTNEQTQQEQVQAPQQETKIVEINVEKPVPAEKEVSISHQEQPSASSRTTTRRESLEPDSAAKKSKFGSTVKSVVTKFTSANRLMSAASSRRQSAVTQQEPLSARQKNPVTVSPRPAESDGDTTHIEDKEFEKYEKIAHDDENSYEQSHNETRQTYHDNIRRGAGSERASTDAFNSRNHDRDESLTKSQFFPKKETPQAQGDVDQSHLSSSSEEETELEAEHSQGRHSNRSDTPGRSFIDDAANVDMATGPIQGKLVNDLKVPRFAFELSHQKMYDQKSFDRKLSQDPLSRVGSPRGKEYVSVKSFYHDILKELEQTPLNIEEDSQTSFLINKAHRIDQVTFSIIQEKLGPQYSQGLYRIFKKYADNCRSNEQDFMNYTRFLTFAKDFGLFSRGPAGSGTTRQNVGMIYTKRCPNKLIDFAAFVDLLYKMSKNHPDSEQAGNKNGFFQVYLDRYVLSQHGNILERQQSPRGRIQAFGREYVAENKALRVLEGHDELIKHVFTLYKSLDIKYSSKSIVQLKDFKNFCSDFCLVPVLVSLNEVHDIFRRFQMGSKPVVDFRGFILALCSVANIGFEKEAYKNKFENFTKRIMKLFELLADLNSKIAPQLLEKDIKKCKF